MIDLIRREPAVIVAVVVAVLQVLVVFGVALTDAQTAAIVALVNTVLALVGGVVIRSRVTPVK